MVKRDKTHGSQYVPQAGEIIWLDFDPHAGREQAKRRPALVITDRIYNRASGLVIVCPLTSRRKPYPFALGTTIEKVGNESKDEGKLLNGWLSPAGMPLVGEFCQLTSGLCLRA